MCHGRTSVETAFPHALGWLAKWGLGWLWRKCCRCKIFSLRLNSMQKAFYFSWGWLNRTHTAHSYWLQYRETPAFLHFYHSLVRLKYSQQSVDNLQSSALISTISSNTQFYKLKRLQSVTYSLLKHSPLVRRTWHWNQPKQISRRSVTSQPTDRHSWCISTEQNISRVD